MKRPYIFLMLILSLTFLVGCDDTKFQVENPSQETTLEMHNALKADTTATLYKVYTPEGASTDMYLVNAETNLVEYKVDNYSGAFSTSMLVIFGLIVIVLLVGAVISTD